MSAYREYRFRVLAPYGGPDLTEVLRDALFDKATDECGVVLVTASDPVTRAFSELTASEAEEITRREQVAYGGDEYDEDDDPTTGAAHE